MYTISRTLFDGTKNVFYIPTSVVEDAQSTSVHKLKSNG